MSVTGAEPAVSISSLEKRWQEVSQEPSPLQKIRPWVVFLGQVTAGAILAVFALSRLMGNPFEWREVAEVVLGICLAKLASQYFGEKEEVDSDPLAPLPKQLSDKGLEELRALFARDSAPDLSELFDLLISLHSSHPTVFRMQKLADRFALEVISEEDFLREARSRLAEAPG